MTERDDLYARFAPTVTDVVGLVAGVTTILDHIDEHLPAIAGAIVQASRIEVPEYAALDAERSDLQFQRNVVGMGIVASMIRNGRTQFSSGERDWFAQLGAELAKEPEPLHAVVRTFQIAAREMINESLRVVPRLGGMAAPALAVVLKIGFGLFAEYVEVMSEAYASSEANLGVSWLAPTASLVSDLVLGVAPESFDVRAQQVALDDARSFRAIVYVPAADASSGPTSFADARIVGQLPTGCIFGRLGYLGVVIVTDADDRDRSAEIASYLEEELASEGDALIAVGPPRHSLALVRESFEAAVGMIEAGRAVGARGVLAAPTTALARLVAAARAAGIDVTNVLYPVLAVERREVAELVTAIGAYVRHGCSVQRGADASHMHRNTMRRRIQRAEELLGFEIAERWVEVEVALAALEIQPAAGQ